MNNEYLRVHEKDNHLGAYLGEPQLLGLIDNDSRDAALLDPSTFVDSLDNPVIVPIQYNSEANQDYFDGESSYFVDSNFEDRNIDKIYLSKFLNKLPPRSKIMFEVKEGDNSQIEMIASNLESSGRLLSLDPKVKDVEDGSIAGVKHFLSTNRLSEESDESILTLEDARRHLTESGEWQIYIEQGVDYINGSKISEEFLEKLWQVYDRTFDKLVENHPSAQKQPREYFEKQILLPESGVIYVESGDQVVSALFLLEDVSVCPWLNANFYKRQNPNGKTVFISCVSTDLNLTGMHLSKLTMGAAGRLGSMVPGICATATQCTNRSEKYIPRLAAEFTKDSVQLDFKEIASYKYPVYVID